MNGASGRADWLANGVMFAACHLHVPWVIPGALLDAFILSYPTGAASSANPVRPAVEDPLTLRSS